MNKLFIGLFLLAANTSYAVTFNDETSLSLGKSDRQLHAITSYAMTYTGAKILNKLGCTDTQAAIISGTTVLMLGLAKEMTDSSGFSTGDLKADVLGTVVGVGMSFAF